MPICHKLDLISSFLFSYHEKAAEALCLGRIPIRLGVAFVSEFLRLNFDTTDQIAECYRASASGSVDLGFNYEFGQPMALKIGIHSFPA